MVEYKHIVVKPATKDRLMEGMRKSDTWDSYLNGLLSDSSRGDSDPYKEIDLVIQGALEDLGMDMEWKKDLHPADVLDKHVFPAIISNVDELKGELESARMRKGSSNGGKVLDSYVEDFERRAVEVLSKHGYAKKPIEELLEFVKGWL